MIAAVLEHFDQQARRMGQMLHRMHVDVVALARHRHGGDFAKARSACAACRSTAVCDRSHAAWLAGQPDPARPEDFCPNARLFAEYPERA